MWNRKNKTNKQTDSYIEQTGGCQRGGGWGNVETGDGD